MSWLRSFYYFIYGIICDFLISQQDRLALWLPVAFGAGIGVYLALPAEPFISTGAAFFLCSVFLLWDTRKKTAAFFLSQFIFLFCAGFFLMQVRTVMLSTPRIKFRMSFIDITGTVQEVVELQEGRSRITVSNVKIPSLADWKTPQNIWLNLPANIQTPQTGDEIAATVFFSDPPSAYTPTSFDFGRQMYFKKIGAVGSLYSDFKILKQSEKSLVRDRINKRIDAVLPESTRGVAKALVTGNAKSIPTDIVQNYQNAGISHILAVSGLHMSLLAGIIFAVIRTTLALIPSLSLRWNTKKIAAVCALIACFIYLHISGAAYAAQRAFIMIAFMLTAILLNRRAVSVVCVAWAAFFILLFSPESLVSAGFQLSFAAVAALICVYEAGIGKYTRLLEKKEGLLFYFLSGLCAVLIASLIASTAVMPFIIFYFRRLPTYSVLGSVLSSSVIGLWVLPSLAVGTLLMPIGLDRPFLLLASYGIELINKTAAFTAGLPHAVLLSPPMPFWGLMLAVIGGLWFCLWKNRFRLWGLALFAFSLLSPLFIVSPDVYVKQLTAAFKNKDGLLEFREGFAEQGAKKTWLTDNRQDRELTVECPYGLCLYEKNGFKIGVAHTRIGAYDACQMKDIDVLFITTDFHEICHAKKQINRSEISKAGTYTLTLRPNKIIMHSVLEKKGFRPWAPAYPVISLENDWRTLTTSPKYSIHAVIDGSS
ncbi:MAG: ComEC/Rec2 family competence protein [Alphaproteobacteria bacterium]|nr:ComEC/Rec2 family competence protein [Alphaproteobacteria bacterium]